MDFFNRVGDWFADDRLLANLVGLHVILAVFLVVSVILRKILMQGGDVLVRWTGLHWLDGISKEAVRKIRALLFWATVCLMLGAILGSVAYHAFGRDIRLDLSDWYQQLTAEQIFLLCLALGQLALLAVGVFFAIRLVRRGRLYLEKAALGLTPQTSGQVIGASALDAGTSQEAHRDTVRRWFDLLQRFALCTLALAALWVAGRIVHLREAVDTFIGFLIRLVAIIMVARLLTLAGRTISHALAGLGNRHLGAGSYRRYWERVTRLFPFGERCFEAAVYVSAASLIIHELKFVAVIADFGPRIVQCIGIFFSTRVLIELLTVLLHEAFGLRNEERPLDQKGQTLVPLLQSIGQYVLYFGSGVIMLGVLGIDTGPILAGAGILGLAAGLGAQSLVTDVVSGFFILFENQYLVGDVVQIGDAAGGVEAVSIRHTQIRDEQGKLYIIPNGQIKSVINFSKGYVNAVVDFKMPASQNLDQAMRDLAEAGRRLRERRREVLGDTVVKGLVELTPTEMTVRAVTRVQPGAHQAMQYEYRRLLKEVLDERKEQAYSQAA
ncbi:MAG: mechanosensitive ion channel family protein [Gemmataceae bacterium]|nr:mechanosensitive ion channel family protein [Gemmataceae bacterium]